MGSAETSLTVCHNLIVNAKSTRVVFTGKHGNLLCL